MRDPWMIAAASESAMFRRIADQRPTLILDEVDAIFAGKAENSEALRGLLNAGNRPRAAVARTVGEGSNLKSVDFPVYCAKVLSGIGTDRWPDTVLDRSIRITLQRKKNDETVARFRHRKAYAETEALRNALAVWAAEHTQALHDAEPRLPDELDDRAAEGWEPLFAIADLADMSEQARKAAIGLAKDAPEDEDGHGVLLLKTLKALFGDTPALHTEAIIEKLNKDDELPSGGIARGSGSTVAGSPSCSSLSGSNRNGYALARTTQGVQGRKFSEAWGRYCTEPKGDATDDNGPDTDVLSGTTGTTARRARTMIPDPEHTANVPDTESAAIPHSNADVPDVRIQTGNPGPDIQTARYWSRLYRRGPRYEPGHPRNRPGHAPDIAAAVERQGGDYSDLRTSPRAGARSEAWRGTGQSHRARSA